MLWSAPCDLRAAEQAVLRYQQAAAESLAPQPPRPPEDSPEQYRPGGPGKEDA